MDDYVCRVCGKAMTNGLELVVCDCAPQVRACCVCGCTPEDIAQAFGSVAGARLLFNSSGELWACPADTYAAFGWRAA